MTEDVDNDLARVTVGMQETPPLAVSAHDIRRRAERRRSARSSAAVAGLVGVAALSIVYVVMQDPSGDRLTYATPDATPTPDQSCGIDVAEYLAERRAPKDRSSVDAESYEGKPLQEAVTMAEADGLIWRIVSVDGRCRGVLRDYRKDRVNFAVEDDQVVKAGAY